MERQYGPSNGQALTKKQRLIRTLLGDDSENDDAKQSKAKQTQELDDVLEITIDNDWFATPKKVHTPTQNTHTEKESLSPQVRSILSQTRHIALLSPLKNTPTRNAHTVAINVSPPTKRTLSRTLTCSLVHAHTPHSQATPKHTHTPKQTFSAKRFASAFSSRKRTSPSKQTHKQANNNKQPKRNTSALASRVRKATAKQKQAQAYTHTSHNTQSVTRSSHTNEATLACTQPSTLTPSCEQPHKDDKQLSRLLTPPKPNKRIHPYKRTPIHSHTQPIVQSLTNNARSLNSITHAHIQKPTHSHNQPLTQSQPAQSPSKVNSIIRTITHINSSQSHSHSHAFNSATITHTRIQAKQIVSVVQPITQVERQPAADKQSEAPNSKTITLKNKYVPNGIKISINVNTNKKLTKNARKKLTRKLISEF